MSFTQELLPTMSVGNLETKNILFQEICSRSPPEFSEVWMGKRKGKRFPLQEPEKLNSSPNLFTSLFKLCCSASRIRWGLGEKSLRALGVLTSYDFMEFRDLTLLGLSRSKK